MFVCLFCYGKRSEFTETKIYFSKDEAKAAGIVKFIVLAFLIFELYNMEVLPFNEFLFFLHLACNMEVRGSLSFCSYGAVFMCQTTGDLKIRKHQFNSDSATFEACVLGKADLCALDFSLCVSQSLLE